MKTFKLSPSKIVLFTKCEKKFYYRYVEGIQEPESPETIRGTIFHKILEDLYNVIDFKKFYGKHWKEIHEQLSGLMRTYLDVEWAKIGTTYTNVFKSEEEKENFKEETFDFIDFYCAKEAYRLYDFFKKNNLQDNWFNKNFEREFMPKSMEEYVDVDNLHGYIDKTINVYGRGIGVVDYKTSKTPLPHALEKGHLLQLKVYAYMLKKKNGELPLHLSIYYSRTGESVYHEVKEEDMKEVESVINAIRNKTRNEKDYERNVTKLCDYCYYIDTCKPYSKV